MNVFFNFDFKLFLAPHKSLIISHLSTQLAMNQALKTMIRAPEAII
jgi:hypothetical protein